MVPHAFARHASRGLTDTSGQYPAWVDVEQVVQAVVLLAILWTVTRPAVRRHFAPTAAT